MMESQRYPDDFDGIVAGAPAYHWTAFTAGFVQNQPPTSRNRPRAVSVGPVCPYPEVAVYGGTGPTDDDASFRCAAP